MSCTKELTDGCNKSECEKCYLKYDNNPGQCRSDTGIYDNPTNCAGGAGCWCPSLTPAPMPTPPTPTPPTPAPVTCNKNNIQIKNWLLNHNDDMTSFWCNHDNMCANGSPSETPHQHICNSEQDDDCYWSNIISARDKCNDWADSKTNSYKGTLINCDKSGFCMSVSSTPACLGHDQIIIKDDKPSIICQDFPTFAGTRAGGPCVPSTGDCCSDKGSGCGHSAASGDLGVGIVIDKDQNNKCSYLKPCNCYCQPQS